jgi:deoxyribose-phosphate aldolase
MAYPPGYQCYIHPPDSPTMAHLHHALHPVLGEPLKMDAEEIDRRVAKVRTRSLDGPTKAQALRSALALIDLTTLEGTDTSQRVEQLCQKGRYLHSHLPDLPTVAAICVYPTLVRAAKKALEGSAVKVASVAGGFPSGQLPLPMKISEVRYALEEGADEIDMVISRGQFLGGALAYVFDEIATIKAACGEARLKVILETGELGTYDRVRSASDIAIAAGADFIKTSTGKIQPAATLGVALVMLQAIRDHFKKTGRMVGIKPAGGIRKGDEALHYLAMVKEELGEAWLTPQWFRIGASGLVDDILMQLEKGAEGRS